MNDVHIGFTQAGILQLLGQASLKVYVETKDHRRVVGTLADGMSSLLTPLLPIKSANVFAEQSVGSEELQLSTAIAWYENQEPETLSDVAVRLTNILALQYSAAEV